MAGDLQSQASCYFACYKGHTTRVWLLNAGASKEGERDANGAPEAAAGGAAE